MTPYYEQDGITIYLGDCRDILPTLEPGYVFLTDPVYGVDGGRGGSKIRGKATYQSSGWHDDEEYVHTVCVPVVEMLIADGLRGAITPGIRCMGQYPTPADIGCFWTPASTGCGSWGLTVFQPILYYGKDPRGGTGAWPTGKQVTERAEQNGHPCPKPINPWKWLLNKVSMGGDTIIDPFMGSGTTLRAAKDLGRRAIGIEIEERYCEIAAKRLQQAVLPLAVPS